MPRCVLAAWMAGCVGCATTKESDTARTGLEQLLISSAVDRSLDKFDLQPIRYAKVYIDQKYLDCVDKNYVIVSMHQRLLNNGCTLVEKPEEADVVLEIGSGAVGTDRTELFVGIPEIPLPPPSPIAIPRLALFTRTKAMGTAKLRVLAYDAKSKLPVVNSDVALARTDFKNMSVLASGSHVSGDIARELERATGRSENFIDVPGRGQVQVAKNSGGQVR
jgi:uncharacterized protein DUF6655